MPIEDIRLITAQGQAIVGGIPNYTDPSLGLWADGEVQPLSKLISGYERYTNWGYLDVSREGMIAARAKLGTEWRMLLLIPMTTREILADGSIAPAGNGVQASMPSPVFCDSVASDGTPQGTMTCNLQNIRVLADGSVLGDLQVSGSLSSKACDNVKGEKGSITQAQLWVNGADTAQATINVQSSKQTTGTRERPYPYAGTFSTTIANVPLTAGVNTFKFTAADPGYHMPGYSTWAVTVQVTDPEEEEEVGGGNPGGTFALTAQLPADTLAAASTDTVQITLNLDGTNHTNVPLTETNTTSGVFAGVLADGRPARLTLSGVGALSATKVDVVEATLLLGVAGSATTYRVGLRETGVATGVFSGGYVSSSTATTNPPEVNGNVGGGLGGGIMTSTVAIDPYDALQQVEKSNGGEFHRYAISVGVPEALRTHFKMAFDDEEYELMRDPASGLMVLQDPHQTGKPFTPSFKPSETSVAETDAEHAERMEDMRDASFAKGFTCGVGYAGVDMVTSTGKALWGGVKFVGRGFQSVGLQFKWVGQWMTGGDTTQTQQMLTEIGDKQMAIVQQSYEMAKFLNGLLVTPQSMLSKIAWAFYMGDKELLDTALHGSESHRQLFQMACEAITETRKEWDHGTEGQRGYITGRIVGEVLSMLIPAGAAGKVLSKIEVLQHLRQTKLFKAAARSVLSAKEAALTITKMCFVAGTKVKTQGEERIHIEDVQAEMKVWSRDENTGEEGLKRVVQAFTTHPKELYRLTYEVRGPPTDAPLSSKPESETLGVTAQHPFWVCNNEPPGFIAAEDLRVGDVLHVGEGKEAVVTRKVLERAPAGETFTTYNFEVEDYHTYFVGKAAVWVHNAAPTSCQQALEMFENLLSTLNSNITSAWLKTSQAIGLAKMEGGSLLQLKFFTEVRPKWLANLANSVPPWLNTAVQHLPTGVKGSAGRLRANMEKVLGITKPKGMASHHIVEKLDNPLAREILEEAGIHIDEAANGVWLSRQKMIDEYAARGQANWLDGLGPLHEGRHSDAYSQAVFERLSLVRGQPADVIRNELQQIAQELIEGTFPW